MQGKSYRQKHWNETVFETLDLIREAAGRHGLTEAECALRWLMRHSKLEVEMRGKLIIGASSGETLEENLRDLEKSPLPEDVFVTV